jgi:hypothetical protein
MKNDIRGLRLENDAWIYSYRIVGRARRMTIGRSSAGLTPQDARKAAQHFAGLVALGRCPASERKASRRREVMTSAPIKDHVERVAAAYLKHAKARTRESTFRETKRVFTVEILPAWKGRRLSEISKADVRQLVERCAKRTKKGVGGNRLLAACKTFLAFAVEMGVLTVSPAAAIRPPAPETARERVLFSDDELGAVWRASLGLGEYGAICRLLILTGSGVPKSRKRHGPRLTWPRGPGRCPPLARKTGARIVSRYRTRRSLSSKACHAATAILPFSSPSAFRGKRRSSTRPWGISPAHGEFSPALDASRPTPHGRVRHGEPWHRAACDRGVLEPSKWRHPGGRGGLQSLQLCRREKIRARRMGGARGRASGFRCCSSCGRIGELRANWREKRYI